MRKATPRFDVQRFTELTRALGRFQATLTYGPEGQLPIGYLDMTGKFVREFEAERRLQRVLAA